MEYGKKDKRISFMDTDKRAADLIIRLKHDGLTKTKFVRAILSGYLERNENIISFLDNYKENTGSQSKNKIKKIKNIEKNEKHQKNKFGLNDGDIQDIFDLLEKEHPDL